MAPTAARKRRTRAHIIADISANYVERIALDCGYSVERVQKDYGYDLLIFTYAPSGEIENGQLNVQLKASDSIRRLKGKRAIGFALDVRDVRHWLREPNPVIVVLFDAKKEYAFTLYLQRYFKDGATFRPRPKQKTISVGFSTSARLDMTSMAELRSVKERVLQQAFDVIKHA